jgi:gliding motility-associated-like protein
MFPQLKILILICFLFLCTSVSYTQVCTGSLGDAVVNINFGTGSGIGSPLSTNTTSYTFAAADCPNDGSYTIISNTTNCFSSSWHSLTEDHTLNDVNGYMMLVNASITPKDFYLDTVTNLCANTTYEFSAWIINVLKNSSCQPTPSRPKLVFNIETTTGTILGTRTTGDILETATPEWRQYGLFFTTPNATNSVVIRITNNAPGGCGNDLALDDITFRPCGPKVTTAVQSNNQTSFAMCVNAIIPVTLNAVISSGYTNPALQWQLSIDNGVSWNNITGATTSTYNFSNTAVGVYQYRLLIAEAGNIGNTNCRIASNITTVTISDLPVVTATSNSPVCEGANLNLMANGAATYSWTGVNNFTSIQQNPSFKTTALSAGTYTVSGFDAFNCSNTESVVVTILPKPIVSITPNLATICSADSVLLTASGGTTYLWKPTTALTNSGNAITYAKPLTTTTYTVIGKDANTCLDSATIKISVSQKPTAFAGDDIVLISGQKTQLNGFVDVTDISYYWTPSDFLSSTSILNPTTSTPKNIAYYLHAVSNAGCGIAMDTVLVKVYNDLYIPNAFTPNGDGKNDTWVIDALKAYPLAKTIICNRFGEIVFEAQSAYQYWNGTYKGKPVPMGGYTYVIDLKNNEAVIKGVVFVVR